MQKIIHLGPLQVSIYADGYIAAGMTACGRGHNEQDEKELASMSLVTSEITCKICKKSKVYKVAAGVAQPSITRIPRMRTTVYQARGAFDEQWNRELRLRFGLPENSVTPEQRTALLAMEDEIHAAYSAKRTNRGFT